MRNRIAALLVTLTAATAVTTVALPASAAEYGITAVVTTFQSDHRFGDAVTYDPDLVPVGSLVGVATVTEEEGMVTELKVRGLVPDREYGAHVHVNPCGATGDDAGPHYQHVRDPKQPSTDPAYANPENEIWLDFTTDAQGAGEARSEVAWSFGDRRPASVVIHEHRTSTAEGKAGTAGARLACVDVSF
ncbi:superoxide dismutase family protein [Saccharomonospora glauca]|jgi:Cu-Zn family superoxide dismutase|uniref:Copper/zinc superoxide dismutase (SODC) n=1 Tax=Saccharomonospora glauca K62 TaxID=928724 RepID=I1D7R3_9PSEU|nr:superoxide dismutase family protein [Saccharomonospora glauca]EIF00988.1 Copper/zinc superoxide dismutase (SODC) [Saccharomonospora glauca K62]